MLYFRFRWNDTVHSHVTGESQETLSDCWSFVPFVFTADKYLICLQFCCLLLLAASSAREDEQDRGNHGMWGRETPTDEQWLSSAQS